MNDYIKTIEELSFNAWPSHKTELYDGWILRYSHNYTHRTNCVNLITSSRIPLEEKVRFCENEYKLEQTPCVFKISPLTDPAVEKYLEEQGYEIQHVTDNMVMPLTDFIPYESDIIVNLEYEVTDEWIHILFALNGTKEPVHLHIVPAMYHAIPKRVIEASIIVGGQMVASGLGILDRDHVGIYAIYVHENHRRKHYAHAICNALIKEAKKMGAKHAYLQVVKNNDIARSLYESLGFHYLYTYWFRVKNVL